MAAVKLNVLHLHLSDDEGFRVESRRAPRLQKLASDGQFYTQSRFTTLSPTPTSAAFASFPNSTSPHMR